MTDYFRCPGCGKSMSDFDYQDHDCVKDLTAENKRIQAEVEFCEDKYKRLTEESNDLLKRIARQYDEIQSMTARCKAAEELLVESKDTILYIKQYVDGRGLSAEDDGDNMIKAINDFLGVI